MSAAHLLQNDLDDLRAKLTADVERLSETLLGAPSKKHGTKNKPRWGANGSLELVLTGPKRGLWVSREGPGGGPIDLIMHAHGCNLASAVAWARSWVGTAPVRRLPPRLGQVRADTAERAELAEAARAIEFARKLARESVPIAGTLAEIYLVMHRGIECPAGGWPDAIRYHAPTRSLLAVATLTDGAVQAVQRVHLAPDGRKAEATAERPVKITNGRQNGALVRLPARADVATALAETTLLAEGPENGLSVWASTGCETWFVFGIGNFQGVKLPAGRRAILCRDDDREQSNADKSLRKAVTAWRTAGIDVAVATPWPERRGDKSDFNDVVQTGGAAAALVRILPHAPTPPKPPVRRVPVAEARRLVDRAVRDFFEVAAAFDPEMAKAKGTPPPVHGVKVGVGIGKSHAARRYAVGLLADLRAKGDRRNVALAVPTHRLGMEQADILEALPAFQAAGLQVETWRGRTAPNPDHPDYANAEIADGDKSPMCGNLEPVFEAQAHGLDVQKTACRRVIQDGAGEKVAHECRLFSDCAYQRQRKQKADLWLVAHEMLFTSKPSALGDLAAVVVDEGPWQDGLEGVEGRGDRFPLDALRGSDQRPQDHSHNPNWLTLQHIRSRAIDALDGLSDGPITRDAMAADGLTTKDAAEARALELDRIIEPAIHPGMPRAQRDTLLNEAEQNRTRLQAGRFWRAMTALLAEGGATASGWAELTTIETAEGPQRVIRLQGHKPVRSDWQVPTLLIDALLSPDLVRPYWPQLEVKADVQAETPHQRIRQVIDRSYSKGRLEPLDDDAAKADPAEARHRLRNLREARAIICREARKYPAGKVLVVAQKKVREAMAGLGPLPRNVDLAHHNAIAGRDEWGDVALLIVLGRCAPSPRVVGRMAEALTGEAVAPIAGWYPRTVTAREMADGRSMTAEADAHPVPICEAIRQQICEGELVQIIGRGRGVNRTADNPLDVLVMTDVPLPLPVHEAIGAAELAPSLADMMLAECAFAFETPRHAAAACPALWPTWEAAKKALDREAAREGKKGTNPYRESLIRECPLVPLGLRRVAYKREGQGQGDAVALFDPLTVTDPEAALVNLLGPLAWCRAEGVDTGPVVRPHPPRKPAAPPVTPERPPAVLHVVPQAAAGTDLHNPPTARQAPLLLLFPGGPPLASRTLPSPAPAAVRASRLPPPLGPPG